MALAHHYRILGLRTGASFGEVKLAYRNLARLYHPDVNPGNQLAKDRFIQVTQAYQALAQALPRSVCPKVSTQGASNPASPPVTATPPKASTPSSGATVPSPRGPEPKINHPPGGSKADQQLKASNFKQLQDLFCHHRYPRAVALVEGLVHRFPSDPEVRQWHAITYYRWGHDLIEAGHLQKAEACLKKAWRIDPHTQSLQRALQKDFQHLAQLRQQSMVPAQG